MVCHAEVRRINSAVFPCRFIARRSRYNCNPVPALSLLAGCHRFRTELFLPGLGSATMRCRR